MTQEKLLAAGLAILNKYGYGGLSLAALADQSGMTKQRIHYHFPDTDQILLLLARQWSETGQKITLEALAASEESREMKILAIAEGMFRWIELHPELARLALVLYQTAPHVKEVGKFMDQARDAARNRIRTLLLQSPTWKKKRPAQVDSMVTDLHAHMYGFAFYIFATNDFNRLGHYRESCLKSLRELLQSS